MTPIIWIFGSLMVAAIAAAFAIALRLAEANRSINRITDDLKIARFELSSLNERHDQEKANIKAMTDARINELTETISNLQKQISQKQFIHYNDLLWLADDPVPFCLACYEKDKKEFRMFVKIEGNPPRYKCHHCGYYPKASKHPNDKEDPPPPNPPHPFFMTQRGWVTKWKDQ